MSATEDHLMPEGGITPIRETSTDRARCVARVNCFTGVGVCNEVMPCPRHTPPETAPAGAESKLPTCPECECTMWPQFSATQLVFGCIEPTCRNGPSSAAPAGDPAFSALVQAFRDLVYAQGYSHDHVELANTTTAREAVLARHAAVVRERDAWMQDTVSYRRGVEELGVRVNALTEENLAMLKELAGVFDGSKWADKLAALGSPAGHAP